MKRIYKILLSLIVILFVAGCIVIHFMAPYAIIQPPKINENFGPEKFDLQYSMLDVKTKEGHKLDGYWIDTDLEESRGLMILVHGVGGCKEHFIGLASSLSQVGIESIVFDLRAHGKSEGLYSTYGFYEKEDITAIVDYALAKKPDLKIGIWGNSLGGAISLQSLEHDKRIQFGIVESTFTDLSQIVFDYKKRMLKGLGIRTVTDYVLRRAGKIAQFDPSKVKPIASVVNIEQPMFMAHGDNDKNISYKYGQALFDNLSSADKEFYLVKGGGHFGLFNSGGDEYKNRIMKFIGRQVD